MHAGEKLTRRRRPKPGGSGGMLPEKILKFRVSEMPSPVFSAGHFQQIKAKENTVISCLFYPSLELSVRYSIYGKKGKEVTSKGRDVYPSDRQTLL